MPQNESNALEVAEGLLPLLDVSLLLLGFFIILAVAGAFGKPRGKPKLPGIEQVMLLRVVGPNELYLSGKKDGSPEAISLDELEDSLNRMKRENNYSDRDKPIVLIYFEDAWREDFPEDWDKRLHSKIRQSDVRYARTYP